ncbi:MAG: von Willebrand factor type A domain-containing protein [Acidobacteriota bacterium]
MTTHEERELERLLATEETPAPPADLLARLQDDIPDTLPVIVANDTTIAPRQRWQLAAAVFGVIGAALLAWTLRPWQHVDEPTGLSNPAMVERAVVAESPVSERSTADAPQVPMRVRGGDAELDDGEASDALSRQAAVAEESAVLEESLATPDPSIAREQERAELRAASPVEELTVTSEAPEIDLNRVVERNREARQETPTASDPWTILRNMPEVRGDRINVGGNESGQSSRIVPKPSVAKPAPPPRMAKPPQPASPSRVNAQVGSENKRFADLRREAQQLEAELKKLEAVEVPAAPVSTVEAAPAPGPSADTVNEAEAEPVSSIDGVTITDMKVVGTSPSALAYDDDGNPIVPTIPRERSLAAPSTGGSAEPNDAPYGDMFFEPYGTNPFIDTEDDRLSTFAVDVDTASYTVARRYLEGGNLPPKAAIRIEELVNYFDYGDPAPEEGDFALHAEGAPSPYAQNDDYRVVRFSVRGRDVASADRPPADLVFVVDVSGSMDRENRLGLVKRALGLLIDELRPDDRVALVIYGSQGQVVLPLVHDKNAIRWAVDRMTSTGATNAEEGLVLGYDLAVRDGRPGAIKRIILCSDGVANVGRTGPESILQRIRTAADMGVELTTVGFGMGNYNDTLMEQLANQSNGRYAYVDDIDEAERIFVENLTGTLQTIAAEAKIQVDFNPETVTRYRLLGYENRDVADQDFRNDAVDAGEIGAGHTVTALYEIKVRPDLDRTDALATIHLRWGSVAEGQVIETSRTLLNGELAPTWESASDRLRLAATVAEYGEILKRSYWAKDFDADRLRAEAQRAANRRRDQDLVDFADLVRRALALIERSQSPSP